MAGFGDGALTESAKGKAQEIASGANWLADLVGSYEVFFNNAREAGYDLAQKVYEFVENPEAVGTDALREAYSEFMGLHSGNFTSGTRKRVDS